MDLQFKPCGARAILINQRMNKELAASITYLVAQVGVDDEALLASLNTLVELLLAGKKMPPGLFATYYQVVINILNGEQDQHVIFDPILEFAYVIERFEIRDLTADSLGSDEVVHLYVQALDTDERLSFEFLSPTADESARARASVISALALMQKVAPDVFAEFNGIVHQVVLAAGSRDPAGAQFDGASSYMLWGALALSVNQQKSDIEMLQALAHEAGHSFLFGLMIDEPLVKNPDEQLFLSPLRDDARPMDGVYHATYVLARMYYAIDTARTSGILPESQLAECDRLLSNSKLGFYDGLEVVRSGGDLSATGKLIMDHAISYMRSV